MNIINFIKKKSTALNIGIGMAFILFINLVVFPFFASNEVDLKTILDLKFGFSPSEVISSLSSMHENGRKRYLLTTLLVDTPYALIYGFVYAFILFSLLQNTRMKNISFLLFIPFFISLFDLVENMGIITFILQFPHINSRFVSIISVANQLKWIFAFITIAIALILIGNQLIVKFFKTTKQA